MRASVRAQFAESVPQPFLVSPRGPQWYAVYTRARHEKSIVQQLERKQLNAYVPLYSARHRWKDRNVTVQLPLFPGYVFVYLALAERLKVLELPGVVRF